jgi:hypothetical protein
MKAALTLESQGLWGSGDRTAPLLGFPHGAVPSSPAQNRAVHVPLSTEGPRRALDDLPRVPGEVAWRRLPIVSLNEVNLNVPLGRRSSRSESEAAA